MAMDQRSLEDALFGVSQPILAVIHIPVAKNAAMA